MRPSNRIRQSRELQKLSQRALAEKCGVSQQHIQRLENDLSPVSMELALAISAALQLAPEAVFPKLVETIRKFPGIKASTKKAEKAFAEAGLDVEGLIWTVEFGFRSGLVKQYTIPSSEKQRLSTLLLNFDVHFGKSEEPSFFCFDSDLYNLCVNLNELTYTRIMFDPIGIDSGPGNPIEEQAPNLLVWFVGSLQPKEFEVKPDEMSDEEEEFAELAAVVFDLDGEITPDGFVSFRDEDGEVVYLRANKIAVLAVPLWLLHPEMVDDPDLDEPAPDIDENETIVQ